MAQGTWKAKLGPPGDVGRSLKVWLTFLFIILIPFQDTALQNTPLKLFGASLSVLPLILLALLGILQWIYRSDGRIRRSWLIIGSYAVIISAVYIVIYSSYGSAIPWKQSLTYGLMSALLLFATFGIEYPAKKWVRLAIYISLFVTIIGITLYTFNPSDTSALLQATPNMSDRPRGFSTEPGELSVQIVVIGTLTAHFLKAAWQKWCVGLLTCALLIYSGSKGGLICLAICAVVLIFAKKGLGFSRVLLLLGLSCLTYLSFILILSSFSAVMLVGATSTISTRLSMVGYAFIVIAHNPFGVGFSGFLPSLPQYLPEAMRYVQSIFPVPLTFVEVREYLYPPYPDADCKTFFFDYFVFFGVPFAVVFATFALRMLRILLRSGCDWLFVGTLFSFFAMLTYYSALNVYAIPLLFGISINETQRRKASICM